MREFNPRINGPSSQMAANRNDRDGQADTRDARAEREVEAGLQPVAPGGAHGRERLGREHEQRDDHADEGRGQAGGGHPDSMAATRPGQPDHRHERRQQQPQADRRLPCRGRIRVRILVDDIADGVTGKKKSRWRRVWVKTNSP